MGGDVPVAQTLALHDDPRGAVDELKRLELMMLRSGNELLIDRVRARIGDEEVDRILALQELKPVPDSLPYYLPRTSRGWVWY